MTILAFLESNDGNLPKAAAVVANAVKTAKNAHGYQRTVACLLGSDGVEAAASQAAMLGFDEVVYLKSPVLAKYLVLNYFRALEAVLSEISPSLFVCASTSVGKDLAPRVAQKLGAAQLSDVIEFLPGGLFKRLMFAGNIVAEVEALSSQKVATIRITAFSAQNVGAACSVREIKVELSADPRQEFVSFETVKSARPDLSEAEVVVSGGRALKSAENFEKYLFPLADALGAAIGASRAAVDSGYAPNDWQVGQTGKVVAPSLYVAVGISGAIQHLAGMKDSKVIVAINKDAESPIFELADYGLVGDLFEILPEFTQLVIKAKSG